MIVDDKKLRKLKGESPSETAIELLAQQQIKQGDLITNMMAQINDSLLILKDIYISLEKSDDEDDDRLEVEKGNLVQVQMGIEKAIKSLTTVQSDIKILTKEDLLEVAKEIVKGMDSKKIEDQLKNISTNISKKREWDFNIIRDSYGKMTQIKAKVQN